MTPRTDGHLSAGDVAGYIDGDLAPEVRRRIEDHLDACERCLAEVIASGRAVDAWETARSGASGRPRSRSRWRRLLLGAGSVAAAAASVALLLTRVPATDGPGQSVPTRTPEAFGEGIGTISTLAPESRARLSGAIEFRWRDIGAVLYRLRVSDATGHVVWAFDTPDTVAVMPVSAALPPGSYFWHVDGVTEGVSSTTRVQSFTVVP